MKSVVTDKGPVTFPKWTGERVYMLPFFQKQGLPQHLRRWQPTVDAMLGGVEAPGKVFIMIDQSFVSMGKPQRRPGLHVDGYWVENAGHHGGHRGSPGRHTGWKHCNFSEPEALILASNVEASRAFVGNWEYEVGEGGDCSGLDVSNLQEVSLKANRVYQGNVAMLHESLPVPHSCLRTLVRLNVPGVHG